MKKDWKFDADGTGDSADFWGVDKKPGAHNAYREMGSEKRSVRDKDGNVEYTETKTGNKKAVKEDNPDFDAYKPPKGGNY